MLFEYKIKKVVDGNGDETFDMYFSNVAGQRWYKKKIWALWKTYDGYLTETSYSTLGQAQKTIGDQMVEDKKVEYERNKSIKTVLKVYKYTDIPEYIPEKQQEKFCDLKGGQRYEKI